MPDPALLTDLGKQMLHMLPPILRDDPDIQGVIHPVAKEVELLDEASQLVLDQAFPQKATILLKAWEALLRTTIEPPGQTLDQRRSAVIAYLQKLKSLGSGSQWEANITQLIGPSWTYQEHDPDDPGSPDPNTIQINLPFAPDSSLYTQTESLIRAITPAHIDIVLAYDGGFILDQSQLDQEPFGY